jgi:hypothetical protein
LDCKEIFIIFVTLTKKQKEMKLLSAVFLFALFATLAVTTPAVERVSEPRVPSATVRSKK